MRSLLRYPLRISAAETSFRRRGFRGGTAPGAIGHIEQVGASFLHGYHTALDAHDIDALIERLERTDLEQRGFHYEGAGMALCLLDALSPFDRHRLDRFLATKGDDHTYMVHVAVGWAMARLPFGFNALFGRMDPLLRWLALDGYGFHEGFFKWPKYLEENASPPGAIRGYGRRAFDQGLGRSLWFVDGHDVDRIPVTIATLAPERHEDLWSGIGLAATYAGGVAMDHLIRLATAAGASAASVAQGACFAAEARRRAGNVMPHVELACQVFCGRDAEAAAAIARATRDDLPADRDGVSAFEIWRRRIRENFVATTVRNDTMAAAPAALEVA